jgi:Fic family protein
MSKQTSELKDQILKFIEDNPPLSSKEIHDAFAAAVGYATVKRILNTLISEHLIVASGNGKATKYSISSSNELLKPIDLTAYFKKEIDERQIRDRFNHEIFQTLTHTSLIFSKLELEHLQALQKKYAENVSQLSETLYKKELERLAIDLSWKSSQIEGNTYSLLETERLLKDKETATGKTKEEANMLLNHKDALDFIIATPQYITPLRVSVLVVCKF